ncbi:radical SAM protein, partial [Candidatus Woesearchaeota archaeon]|nr:radical SAM protein [Candidatus Woesearchaeota archaeon]
MKLYVLPVETACNAACPFCITDYRQTARKELLDIGSLDAVLNKYSFERIEITGGGEPLLHHDIGRIVEKCAASAQTHLYTNGIL